MTIIVKCQNCLRENPDGSKYCRYCGGIIRPNSNQTPPILQSTQVTPASSGSPTKKITSKATVNPALTSFVFCMLCGNIIFMPIFGLMFNNMVGGLGWLIGILAGLLTTLSIICVYFGKKMDSAMYYGVSFLLVNFVVGFFVYGIMYSLTGMTLSLDNPIEILQFIGITFVISVIVVLVVLFAIAAA